MEFCKQDNNIPLGAIFYSRHPGKLNSFFVYIVSSILFYGFSL
jgi:hypothetical protein